MNRHHYKEWIIEIIDEPAFQHGSADNRSEYDICHISDNAGNHQTSKHGIRLFRNGLETGSCIVAGSGGTTGVHEGSSLVEGDLLLVCCGHSLFCLKLPALELQWNIIADEATCFQVFRLYDDFLIQGEMQITRVSREGRKRWHFSGGDIFVSMEGEEVVRIGDDRIMLMDFAGMRYVLDFDGTLIPRE